MSWCDLLTCEQHLCGCHMLFLTFCISILILICVSQSVLFYFFPDYIKHTAVYKHHGNWGTEYCTACSWWGYHNGQPHPPEEPWSAAAGEKYKARVWEDLRHLFQQNELTDVMLVAEGQSIPCHKGITCCSFKVLLWQVCSTSRVTGQQSSEYRRRRVWYPHRDCLLCET